MTKKHAPQYFICSPNLKSPNVQTESLFKCVASTYRGSTTLCFLVCLQCLTLRTDREMAGLLMLFVFMEQVCGPLVDKCVALSSDNSPTVRWVDRLAWCQWITAAHLIQALALRLKAIKCCSLTLQHISGGENAMTDIPSHLFRNVPHWHYKTDPKLLMFFNKMLPLPIQQSWTAFHPSLELGMHMIFVLQTRHTTLDTWWRLPSARNHVGNIGSSTLNLW